MKAGEKFWVRDNEGTWCICDYWDRTKDGDRFCVVADIDRVIILPPDSPWIKCLSTAEAGEVKRIENRLRALAEEQDNVFLELANMSFKKD